MLKYAGLKERERHQNLSQTKGKQPVFTIYVTLPLVVNSVQVELLVDVIIQIQLAFQIVGSVEACK